MAMAYAEEIGALYLETSAKDDTNVQDIFVKLSKCYMSLIVTEEAAILFTVCTVCSVVIWRSAGECRCIIVIAHNVL